MNGTSFAAPMMSGVCALILAKHRQLGHASKTPCETPKQMMEHLIKYATDLGDGKTSSGFGTIDTKSMFMNDEETHTKTPTVSKKVHSVMGKRDDLIQRLRAKRWYKRYLLRRSKRRR